MPKLDVLNQKGEVTGKIELDSKVFDGKLNYALMHQAVVSYLANQRKGTACSKTKGEVRGGGRKPWRQKGTGRARVGSIRSPLWRGGGVIFGPKPRDYYKKLPKRMRVLALKSALNAKMKDKEILILESLQLSKPKTKEFFNILKNLGLNGIKTRFVIEQLSRNLKLATQNLKDIDLELADSLTTYTTLDCKKIIFTKKSLLKVEERIKKWLKA
jgi:large subunit ribosomal protein L4